MTTELVVLTICTTPADPEGRRSTTGARDSPGGRARSPWVFAARRGDLKRHHACQPRRLMMTVHLGGRWAPSNRDDLPPSNLGDQLAGGCLHPERRRSAPSLGRQGVPEYAPDLKQSPVLHVALMCR